MSILLTFVRRWRDVESDTSKTLEVVPNDLQALYRRALSRMELHKLNIARDGMNTTCLALFSASKSRIFIRYPGVSQPWR